MSVTKFDKIITSVNNLIDWCDSQGFYGPIEYLEDAQESLDRAKDEYLEMVNTEVE